MARDLAEGAEWGEGRAPLVCEAFGTWLAISHGSFFFELNTSFILEGQILKHWLHAGPPGVGLRYFSGEHRGKAKIVVFGF